VGLGDWVRQELGVPIHRPATSSWIRRHRVTSDSLVTLTVALRIDPERQQKLERTLFELSDPGHPRYGLHLGQDEVTELLAIPSERVAETYSYFSAAGAVKIEIAPNSDMLTVTMRGTDVEVALRTELRFFEHRERGSVQIVRASSHYHLPSQIAEHVSMIGEILQFPRIPPTKSSRGQVDGGGGGGNWTNSCEAHECAGLVTPEVIALRYMLPSSTPYPPKSDNTMSVVEFEGEFFNTSDLEAFGKSCHRNVRVDTLIGDNKPLPGQPGIEAELDIEYIKSVAPEIPLTVIYINEYSLLQWVNQINSMSNPPLVHSVSYGMDEAQQVSSEFMQVCNIGFMKAGIRGLTILVASGDMGVCGREGCGNPTEFFHPDFPAASPFVTVVGGTDFEGDGIGPEMAWQNGGGGFSDSFAMPAYQADAISAYLHAPDAKLPPQRFWNSSNRGYPDVAALAGSKAPYCINTDGSFWGITGTSASTPVVAGVFAKLNGLRSANGQRPLGFLNPFIYGHPEGFQDVTSGTNKGEGTCGFSAVKGWDAATGLGTPNFTALAAIVARTGALKRTSFLV